MTRDVLTIALLLVFILTVSAVIGGMAWVAFIKWAAAL